MKTEQADPIQGKVFLSYAVKDRKWASSIRDALLAQGVRVFDPAAEVLPGQNWARVVAEGLEASDAMVVMTSPAAARSPHTRQEIEYALTQPRFADRLISVEIKPTTEMPWILKQMPSVSAVNVEQTGKAVVEALANCLDATAA